MNEQEEEEEEEDLTSMDHIIQKMTSSSSKRRGWAGEEMEINHQYKYNIEQQQEHQKTSICTAVDLSQFRNEQVGKGYQSKGVIRQRSMGDKQDGIDSMKIVDMTKRKETDDNGDDKYLDQTLSTKRSSKRRKNKKLKKHGKRRKHENLKEKGDKKDIEKYLQCEGMRIFRKEIEKIYVEATQLSKSKP